MILNHILHFSIRIEALGIKNHNGFLMKIVRSEQIIIIQLYLVFELKLTNYKTDHIVK